MIHDLIRRAAEDLVKSNYAIALTGAGISTESGVPDFRGPSGLWTKNPDAENRAYLGYEKFVENPKEWWINRLARPISRLGNMDRIKPNPGHYALADLESIGILKCIITQNIDGLHEKAGSKRVLEYHGNSLKLRCISCGKRYKRTDYDLDNLKIQNQLPPLCFECGGIIKTDGVAFGEPIPSSVANQSLDEVYKCDLILICGTSAVVYPFAALPRIAKGKLFDESTPGKLITVVEINAESTPLTNEGISDYLIQGKTGEILPLIISELKSFKR
ncbi:MAG: NAD-dependent deacylase [Chloroflexi bacterium]|nr:NAD-dependent deacylase [Chloroflexota bacterium]